MLDQKIFGEKLRNHRKKLGMTQEDVAEKVGVSPQAISKWESGDCLPDCFNLKAISDVYKISADVLLESFDSRFLRNRYPSTFSKDHRPALDEDYYCIYHSLPLTKQILSQVALFYLKQHQDHRLIRFQEERLPRFCKHH